MVDRLSVAPAKHGSDTGHQFVHAIGFGKEVIRAHLHGDDDIDLVRSWTQNDDRNLRPGSAQVATHVDAGHAGKDGVHE
ncbi:MAG: hypothetical protein ABSE47_17395 [Acidimicrobiales bacterium]|jgi:hypothetical protein